MAGHVVAPGCTARAGEAERVEGDDGLDGVGAAGRVVAIGVGPRGQRVCGLTAGGVSRDAGVVGGHAHNLLARVTVALGAAAAADVGGVDSGRQVGVGGGPGREGPADVEHGVEVGVAGGGKVGGVGGAGAGVAGEVERVDAAGSSGGCGPDVVDDLARGQGVVGEVSGRGSVVGVHEAAVGCRLWGGVGCRTAREVAGSDAAGGVGGVP